MKELFFRQGGQQQKFVYKKLKVDHNGFLKIVSFEVDESSHRMELMVRGPAAVVLPVDHDERVLYLIEQPRHPRAFVESEDGKALLQKVLTVYGDGWQGHESFEVSRDQVTTLESPAGMIDPGETPIETAVRELREETGIVVEEADLEEVLTYYPSVGGSDERITLFFARVSSTLRRVELSDEDRHRVTVWKLSFDDAFRLLDEKKIVTASTNILFRELYIRDKLRD